MSNFTFIMIAHIHDDRIGVFCQLVKFSGINMTNQKDKNLLMYCTGGIRCEKASAWMKELDIPVIQLDGGILNYFRQIPDAEKDWEGECFVFDNRIALDTKLQETGTTLEDVYEGEPDGEWRLNRAKRLNAAE